MFITVQIMLCSVGHVSNTSQYAAVDNSAHERHGGISTRAICNQAARLTRSHAQRANALLTLSLLAHHVDDTLSCLRFHATFLIRFFKCCHMQPRSSSTGGRTAGARQRGAASRELSCCCGGRPRTHTAAAALEGAWRMLWRSGMEPCIEVGA
jgi:hypothetical protein